MKTDTVIGIIGGSGVYDIKGLKNINWTKVDSPFGGPSDEYLVGEFEGLKIVFLPRHGRKNADLQRRRKLGRMLPRNSK